MSTKLRIVFMGTSGFSLKSLSMLRSVQDSGNFEIVAVYTQVPKASGRNYKIVKSPVHQFAEKSGIPVFTPISLRKGDALEVFQALHPDLCIVSSYGMIIPQNMLDVPQFGFINIHASLLPRWRGASPIRAAIRAGDSKSGITIMKMDAGIDTGDIISMRSVAISPKMNHGELEEQLGDLGAEMIADTVKNLELSLKNAYKQPEDGSCYAAKISKESYQLNWSDSAENILRHIMSLSPDPCAWTEIDGLRLKIIDADVVQIPGNTGAAALSPGTVLKTDSGIVVACGSGFLKPAKVHPAGKNAMKWEDFLNGRRDVIGKTFSN